MAQLPPRVPTITANWPDFSDQKMESLSINPNPNPSWVDDFLDFSSTRRGSHRRSMSDDEQLMTMFNDDVGLPSSPSDHNSIDGDDKHHLPNSKEEEDADKMNADPKRIKRILANRQSAQRSRVRKLHYISELERSVTSLQGEVSVLSPRVAFLDHQRLVLNVDNSVLKQRIAALAQDKIFKDAHQEALKREIERLRQIYYHQKKIADNNSSADKEQLIVN